MQRPIPDPYEPTYHFVAPDNNPMQPGDPNGAFFADGEYHPMCLYRDKETGRYHWGHVSSTDLLHRLMHRDAIVGKDKTAGCFSGGALLIG